MVCPKGTGKSKRHIWEPVLIDGFVATEKGLIKAVIENKKCLLCRLVVPMPFNEDIEEIKKAMKEAKEEGWSIEYG